MKRLIGLIAFLALLLTAQAAGATDLYWIGGTGNTNDTAHWSTSSGGSTCSCTPTSADNVFFDAASDSGAGFTVTVNAAFNSLDWSNTAVDQTMTWAGSSAVGIYGSLSVKSTTTWSYTGTITFRATATGKTINMNGVASVGAAGWVFDGVGGEWTLLGAVNLSAGTNDIIITNGSFQANGQSITARRFSSNNSNTRTVNIANSTVTVTNASTSAAIWSATNLTFSATGSTVIMNASGSKTFNGGGLTWGTLTQGGTGALTIAGSNTFADINNTANGNLIVTAGTTQTVGAFSFSGIGSQITLGSSTTSAFTLSKASGTVTVTNLSISWSTAQGGATWDASAGSNTNGGNNSGWCFSSCGGGGGGGGTSRNRLLLKVGANDDEPPPAGLRDAA